MPLVVLTSRLRPCPDPSQLSCDGASCSHGNDKLSTRCCPNRCGTMTLISLPSLSRITKRGLIENIRSKRNSLQCSNTQDITVNRGCSQCVCKYNRWECIHEECHACLVLNGNNTTKTRVSHGGKYESGCLKCNCSDGNLRCDHSSCGSCKFNDNETR